MVTQHVVPGISYAFIEPHDIELHYFGDFGYESPYCTKKVDKDTIYDIASLTKVMATTTRILQLIDEEKISFTTKVDSILSTNFKDVTIAQLLLHCGGFAQDIPNKYECDEENIRMQILSQTIVYEPESKCIYSDIGYLLLGMIIEQIDHCTLEETFQTHIFKPLGMKHTGYKCIKQQNCLPYELNNGVGQGTIQDYKARIMKQAGSAGLFTTLADASIFTSAYLNKNTILFSKKRYDDIISCHTFLRTFGWSKEYGEHTLYHTGFTGTSIFMDMDKQKGFVLFTNRTHPTRDNTAYLEIRKQIIELYQKEII